MCSARYVPSCAASGAPWLQTRRHIGTRRVGRAAPPKVEWVVLVVAGNYKPGVRVLRRDLAHTCVDLVAATVEPIEFGSDCNEFRFDPVERIGGKIGHCAPLKPLRRIFRLSPWRMMWSVS